MKKYLNTLFVTSQGAYPAKEGETVVVNFTSGVGPREVSDISRKTIKLCLVNGAILTFSRAKRAFF
jgi:hypothetical protein